MSAMMTLATAPPSALPTTDWREWRCANIKGNGRYCGRMLGRVDHLKPAHVQVKCEACGGLTTLRI